VITLRDISDLVASECAALTPPPAELLFSLRRSTFNIVTDQQLTPTLNRNYRPKRIMITNASISLTTTVDCFYTAANKGSTALSRIRRFV
jgi:hypothetical protein